MRFLSASVLLAVLLLASCADKPVPSLDRENLFQLSIGRMEDQIDLFRLEGRARPRKTRLAMRDGIVYLSDGNGAKVVSYTSYGDLLSMIYDAESNPPPINLRTDFAETEVVTRRASAYPLNEAGEIAVNSRKEIFVEDRVPAERRTYDAERRTMLDSVVLRFGGDGRFIEYLGQEGIGGTPFPLITGLYVSAYDELVVVCRHVIGWNVYWFDPEGNLLYLVLIERDDLPLPEGRRSKPSLDKIIPAVDDRKVYLKVDYYKDTVDDSTNTRSGIGYDGSILWTLDVKTGAYSEPREVPVLERVEVDGVTRTQTELISSFLGVAKGGKFFFSAPEDGGYALILLAAGSPERKRGFIRVDPEELVFNSFFLSDDGILSALLASEFEAKIVWWRTDRLIGEPRA